MQQIGVISGYCRGVAALEVVANFRFAGGFVAGVDEIRHHVRDESKEAGEGPA